MDIGTLSSRYANALFSLATDKGEEERVYKDIKMLADSFLMEKELQTALDNPLVSDADKEKILIAAGGIEVCDLYIRFIRLVLQHKRESILLFIARSFIEQYRRVKKITRVRFTTAVPVDKDIQEHLQKKLSEETGYTVEFSGRVNPDLIGGFQLQIGNYRLDTSYASQLRRIRSGLLAEIETDK